MLCLQQQSSAPQRCIIANHTVSSAVYCTVLCIAVCTAYVPWCMLQEVEEARRLYTSQKRALKDALSAAAEREAAETAAGESGLEAATAAAEEEVERLVQVRT